MSEQGNLDTYNEEAEQQAADVAVEKAKRRAELEAEQLRKHMASVGGRSWVYGVLLFCHVHEQPFIQGSPDGTAFRCGEMNVGNKILADLQANCPDLYVTMIEEAKQNGW